MELRWDYGTSKLLHQKACHLVAAFFRCLLTKDFTSGVLSGLARVTNLEQCPNKETHMAFAAKRWETCNTILNNKSLAMVSESIGDSTFPLPLRFPSESGNRSKPQSLDHLPVEWWRHNLLPALKGHVRRVTNQDQIETEILGLICWGTTQGMTIDSILYRFGLWALSFPKPRFGTFAWSDQKK